MLHAKCHLQHTIAQTHDINDWIHLPDNQQHHLHQHEHDAMLLHDAGIPLASDLQHLIDPTSSFARVCIAALLAYANMTAAAEEASGDNQSG